MNRRAHPLLQISLGLFQFSAYFYSNMIISPRAQNVTTALGPPFSRLLLNEGKGEWRSEMSSLRDLGRVLSTVRILWLSGCGISDLDGIEVCEQLTELYISFNAIKDLSPLFRHSSLEVLDLDHNKINSLQTVEFISSIRTLRSLSLEGNPICFRMYYRRMVCLRTPHIHWLDNRKVTEKDREPVTEKEEKLLNQDMKRAAEAVERLREGIFPGGDALFSTMKRKGGGGGCEGSGGGTFRKSPRSPTHNAFSPMTSRSPKNSGFAFPSRSTTSRSPNNFQSRPCTPISHSMPRILREGEEKRKEDTSSTLTYGRSQAIRGSFINSLRDRRRAREKKPP
ncbi:hypothetical protein AAMO2058_000840000 [Amorphochlora amoebiformis]